MARTVTSIGTRHPAGDASPAAGDPACLSPLDFLDHPVFVHDEAFRLVWANKAYWQAAGRGEEQALGQPYWQVFPRDSGPGPLCGLSRLGVCESCRDEIQAGQRTYAVQGFSLRRQGQASHCSLHVLNDITELKQAESSLRKEADRARLILDAAPLAMLLMDDQGGIVQANVRAAELFGYPLGDMSSLSVEDLMPSRYRTAHREYRRQATAHLPRPRVMGMSGGDFLALHRDGREFPVEVGLGPCVLEGQRYVVVSVNDISERKRAEEELRIAAIAFQSQSGMIVTDARGSIVRVNAAFTRLTGYAEEEAIGKSPALLNSGRQDPAYYRNMWATLKETGYWQGEIWNRHKNGKIYAEWLTITAVRNPTGEVTHYVGTFSDITQNSEAEAEIHRLAYYDPLTLLPNRRLLHDRLNQALACSSRSKRYGAVMFLDLDNFKTLNDTRGHAVGDHLLIEVARRLQASLREADTISRVDDTVSRLGGDEFVIVLEDLSESAEEAAFQSRMVGEKLREALSRPYELDDGRSARIEFHCTASLGITLFHNHDETVEALLSQADMALYQAKSAGRNSLRFYDPTMQAALDEHTALESDLRQALQRRQLHLLFQPQFDAARRIIGAEALLRWRHPQRGEISPVVFIPLAEDSGLIQPIGQWVLSTAGARLRDWAADPATRHLSLAVNVSIRQFRQPDFVAIVRDVIGQTGAAAENLKIELTESLVIDDVDDTIAKMQALKALGVRFSLDDFGTGYSSLSYLKRLPLDQLKIDRSFVGDVITDPNDAAIVQTIITMGRTLGLDVIAEGVETEAQRDFLGRNGCHTYQGYLFSRPLEPEAFEALLRAH
ncbi:MAG TPA: EAL domain-containing protein [Thiobacillaceae bacterium]|nr:EAL domain-containing protein [Thiobacillaceae bacterium]